MQKFDGEVMMQNIFVIDPDVWKKGQLCSRPIGLKKVSSPTMHHYN